MKPSHPDTCPACGVTDDEWVICDGGREWVHECDGVRYFKGQKFCQDHYGDAVYTYGMIRR